MEHARSLFAEFEQLVGKREALPKLREAMDAAMDVLEGECSDDDKRRATNLMQAHWRRLSEQVAAFLKEPGPTDWQQCNYFLALMDLFEEGLGDDQLLREQRGRLNYKLAELL